VELHVGSRESGLSNRCQIGCHEKAATFSVVKLPTPLWGRPCTGCQRGKGAPLFETKVQAALPSRWGPPPKGKHPQLRCRGGDPAWPSMHDSDFAHYNNQSQAPPRQGRGKSIKIRECQLTVRVGAFRDQLNILDRGAIVNMHGVLEATPWSPATRCLRARGSLPVSECGASCTAPHSEISGCPHGAAPPSR